MTHAYSHLYGTPVTRLRFFAVYGPWERPDMSLFLFVRKILAGEPIDVFHYGNHRRHFTYIDDIVDGVVRVLGQPAKQNPNWSGDAPDSATSHAPYALYNVGNNNSVELEHYIKVIEDCLGKRARCNLLPFQPGDVIATSAEIDDLVRDLEYRPGTPVEVGVKRFVVWYKNY